MLKAILQGKAGRAVVSSGIEQSWREIFRQREDLLTSTFFERLRYLSAEGERSVLKVLSPSLNVSPGAIESISFWPRLTGLANRSFVEPDVLITCENVIYLIEVKPPFTGQQSFEQWRAEIESLVLQKAIEDSDWVVRDRICFVALGRNVEDWRATAIELEIEYAEDGLSIHALEWDDINHGVAKLLEVEEGRDATVYRDWLDAFSLFGLIDRPAPFEDLLPLLGKISSDWRQVFDIDARPLSQSIEENADWPSIMKLINRHTLEANLWA